jgi:hypothetical protein
MRLRALIVVALLCAAGPAQAVSAILHFDGEIDAIYANNVPSLTALGLYDGMPVHYEVKIDTDALAYHRSNGVWWRLDFWNAPDDHTEYFYAELVAQPYPTPGSYFGWGREFFWGADVTSFAFGCAPLGRLFVGVDLFHIDGCGAIEDWELGQEVGSAHVWHDPSTGESATVYASMTLTQIVPVPEPGAAAMLASGATLLACLHKRRSRA